MTDPKMAVVEETEDPRAGFEEAHEHGVLLQQPEVAGSDPDDPGEVLDVQALAGFMS